MRCIIIDDHPGIAHWHALIMKEAGCEKPELYTDSRKGLAALESCREPALVLMDLMMPHYSGADILKKLNAMNASDLMRFIIISSDTDEPAFVDSDLPHLHIMDRITKPAKPEKLAKILKEARRNLMN